MLVLRSEPIEARKGSSKALAHKKEGDHVVAFFLVSLPDP